MRGGPINVESLAALQEVLQRFIQAHQRNDVETQRYILQQLIQREKDSYQRKLRLLAELKTLIQEARAGKDAGDRIARLIAAFKFAAELRAVGYQELDDKETGDTAQKAKFDLYNQLKSIPEGRAELIKLLDDPNVNVRSSVAVLLLRQMPGRAIPVIEEIERTARGTDASFSAGFALRRYRSEIEPKP